MRLVGIIGNAGAGKDTVADILHNHYCFDHYKFAGILKEACRVLFGLGQEELYGNMKEEINGYWGVSSRKIQQFVGTELFRDSMEKLIPGIGSDFWIRALEMELTRSCGPDVQDDNIVISDVRFANEIDWILKQSGILIVLTRPNQSGEVGIVKHESENIAGAFHRSQLLFAHTKTIYHMANIGSLEHLREEVEKFAQKYDFAIPDTRCH